MAHIVQHHLSGHTVDGQAQCQPPSDDQGEHTNPDCDLQYTCPFMTYSSTSPRDMPCAQTFHGPQKYIDRVMLVDDGNDTADFHTEGNKSALRPH